jgi:hypothetical protein
MALQSHDSDGFKLMSHANFVPSWALSEHAMAATCMS